jgi:hypothetical protein
MRISAPLDRAADRASAAAALGVAAVCLLPTLSFRMGVDQGTFAYMSAELLEGRWPYIATWDHQAPGGMLLHAAQMFVLGKSIPMFRLADWLYQLVNVLLIYDITRRVADRAGACLAAGVYALVYQGYGPWNTAQREGFALLWILLAFRLFQTAARRAPGMTALAVGCCLGVAATIKPTLIAFGAMFLPLLLAGGPPPARERVRLVGLAAVGLLLPALPILLAYAARGEVHSLYDAVIVYNRDIYAHRLRGDDPRWTYWFGNLTRLGGHAVAIALAYPPFLLIGQARLDRLVLFTGYLCSIATVVVQGTFAGYHYLPGLGLGAILLGSMFSRAAALLARAVRPGRLRASTPMLAVTAVLLAAVPFYVHPQRVRDLVSGRFLERPRPGEFRNGSVFDFTESYDLAEYLAAHTAPGDRVQIWGHESLVYYLAGRDAASRFQTSNGLVMRPPGRPITEMQRRWRREFMADLRRHAPRYVVVVRGDNWWWAPGQRTSEELLDDFPELADFIRSDHEFDRSIGRFRIYRRRAPRPRAAAYPASSPHDQHAVSTPVSGSARRNAPTCLPL